MYTILWHQGKQSNSITVKYMDIKEVEGGDYSLGGICLRLSNVCKHATSKPRFIVAIGLQVALAKHELCVGSVFTFVTHPMHAQALSTKYMYTHSVQFT